MKEYGWLYSSDSLASCSLNTKQLFMVYCTGPCACVFETMLIFAVGYCIADYKDWTILADGYTIMEGERLHPITFDSRLQDDQAYQPCHCVVDGETQWYTHLGREVKHRSTTLRPHHRHTRQFPLVEGPGAYSV